MILEVGHISSCKLSLRIVRDRERERQRQTERQTERDRQRERERQTETDPNLRVLWTLSLSRRTKNILIFNFPKGITTRVH